MDVEAIFSELEDHGFEDASEDRKLSALNAAYQECVGMEAWPFLQTLDTEESLSFSDGTVTASEPLRAVLMFRTTQGELEPMRLDSFLKQFGHRTTQAGEPRLYYFVGNDVKVWPVPTSTPTGAVIAYIRDVDDLEADSSEDDIILPREYHRDLLVNGALYKLYAMEDDAELANLFQSYYMAAIAKMREKVWRKQYQKSQIVEEPSTAGLY